MARKQSFESIGRALGVSRETARRRAIAAGEHVPGTALDEAAVAVYRPARVEELRRAAHLDPKVWVPTRVTVRDGPNFITTAYFKRAVSNAIEVAIADFVRAEVRPTRRRRPARRAGDQMLVWGMWDTHIGMYAWNEETRNDFDVRIASDRVKNSIDDMLLELAPYKIGRVVMPVGNDWMHFDSVRQQTAMGEHFLDSDGRFAKVYTAALDCLAYFVEAAARVAGRVDVLYVPGNHDTTSGYTLCVALAQRYRGWKGLTFDLGANPRKYITHGGVLIGFDHGHDCPANRYPMIFATEAHDEWSRSTYREVQTGHKHQRWEKEYEGVVPTNGVLVRRNPSLSNVDAWHHKQGMIGEPVKSVEAWRYDEVAYRGSHVTWARDERRK